MAKNKIYIFLEFKSLKIVFSAFNSNYENKYFNSIDLDFSKKELSKNLPQIIREHIIKIEKKIDEFINDVNVILDLNKSINIKLNIFKKKEDSKVTNDDIKYLIQDARQQVIEQNKNLKILHILVENYYINKVKKTKISNTFYADDFSINLNFICYPYEDLINFRNLLKSSQIQVTKFICSNYLETISNDDIDQKLQISNAAIKTIMGTVENEVLMVPKVNKKYGFFERIFKLFQK